MSIRDRHPPAATVVVALGPGHESAAGGLASELGVPVTGIADWEALPMRGRRRALRAIGAEYGAEQALLVGPEGVALHCLGLDETAGIGADFTGPQSEYRRLRGGGSGQLIARAVGLPGAPAEARPSVLDCTAGLGADAFVLACLGCEVTLVERNPLVLALLRDGVERGRREASGALAAVLARMEVRGADAIACLGEGGTGHDVACLDPMFPERRGSAAPGKAMQAFRSIVGDDADAPELLAAALASGVRRVVVKRPLRAPPIAGPEPGHQVAGKSSRFDVYLPRTGG